jgi:hypothetical protein
MMGMSRHEARRLLVTSRTQLKWNRKIGSPISLLIIRGRVDGQQGEATGGKLVEVMTGERWEDPCPGSPAGSGAR